MPHALLFTLGAFVLILILARVKVPLAAAVLVGAGAVGLLFGLPPMEILRAGGMGAAQPRTIGLIVVMFLLLLLSELMRHTGQLDEIVTEVRALLRRPVAAMAALPAFIGLLPMPGGALFSAPMVETAAGDHRPAGGMLSAINYWFRHIWEYWWPLYPGVILAVSISGGIDPRISWGRFIAFNMPLTVFMLVGGLILFRRVHPSLREAAPPPARGTKRRLIRASSSIWGVLIIWGAVKLVFFLLLGAPPEPTPGEGPFDRAALLEEVHKFAPLVIGLIGSLVWTIRFRGVGARPVGRLLLRGSLYKLALLALSVMVFQYVLREVGAPGRIGDELERLHVPPVLVVAALPFIAGLVTGLAIGFVGTSFPIVLGMVAAVHGAGNVHPYVVLAYAFGHMGQMMSPLHLCHVVSNKYFRTTFGPVYTLIIPAAVVTGVLAVGYFVLLRLVMGG